MTTLEPRPRASRRRRETTELDLDEAQRAAVLGPSGGALLVLGEAGHGKTTVAVHRLAHLFRSMRDARSEGRAAFIVPTEGLARLVQSQLRRLGADVEAITYDAWAGAEARRAFRDIPKRESELTPARIAAFKRHPALDAAIRTIASRAPAILDDDVDAPRVRSRAHARRADLQQLFGDRALLEQVAPGARVIDDVLDRTRVQFSLTGEQEFSHVTDAARLIAIDRRTLDDGTAHANAGTVDVEDYAILFAIDRLRAQRARAEPKKPRPFDVIAIDEAQELAPLELALIGRSLAPGGTLIVAGDADQQVDPTTSFLGWDKVMRALGCDAHAELRLEVGYRCAPSVVDLARAVLGGSAGIEGLAFDDEGALATWLGGEARTLARRDPRASLVAICRSPIFARRFADRLRRETPTRLVFDGRFLSRGPLQVTTVDETKGLEFDFVIVPDATADAYPDNAASRRALYVAVTRARHRAVLAHAAPPSPIVRGA